MSTIKSSRDSTPIDNLIRLSVIPRVALISAGTDA